MKALLFIYSQCIYYPINRKHTFQTPFLKKKKQFWNEYINILK